MLAWLHAAWLRASGARASGRTLGRTDLPVDSTKVEQSEINDTVRAMPAKAKVSIPNGNNKFVVLLAKPLDSNTVEVLYQFEEDSIGDSLATRAYKAQQKLAKEAEKRPTAVDAAEKLTSERTAQGEA